jgi:hypothetical protein
MADLTSSGVTVERSWTEGGPSGKLLSARQVTLVLAAAGGTTAGNQIPATVLGFKKILDASLFVASDNSNVFQASPSYDGTLLVLLDSENATATNHNNPFGAAGITATVRGVVRGDNV